MADKTGIEWTDATWNPVVGCSIVSPGCTNCYAMRQAARIERMAAGAGQATHYAGTTQASKAGPVWTGKLALAPEHIITQPLRWKRPRRIFVNSMGDLFHESVPDAWIDQVFAVMALSPQHTFQVLTKRAARMRDYCQTIQEHGRWLDMEDIAQRLGFDPRGADDHGFDWISNKQFLPNVWLGVSAEDQTRADERIPYLLATPAAVRFVSAEPLLGPIDFTRLDVGHDPGWSDGMNALLPYTREQSLADWGDEDDALDHDQPALDWIIGGGESGPGARPMHPDWARSIRDQCAAAGVPFFFKQWGNWTVEYDRDLEDPDWRKCPRDDQHPNARYLNLAGGFGFHGERVLYVRNVGKARAGRLLDGIEHNATPAARP